MSKPETFGETLQRLRKEAGLSQAKLAEKAGINVASIRSWEIDHRCPVSPEFWSVLSALGMDKAGTFALAKVDSREKKRRPRGRLKKAK